MLHRLSTLLCVELVQFHKLLLYFISEFKSVSKLYSGEKHFLAHTHIVFCQKWTTNPHVCVCVCVFCVRWSVFPRQGQCLLFLWRHEFYFRERSSKSGKRQVPRKSAQRSMKNKLKEERMIACLRQKAATNRAYSLDFFKSYVFISIKSHKEQLMNLFFAFSFCLFLRVQQLLYPTLYLPSSCCLYPLYISAFPPPVRMYNKTLSLLLSALVPSMHSCMLDVSPSPFQHSSWQNISTSMSQILVRTLLNIMHSLAPHNNPNLSLI